MNAHQAGILWEGVAAAPSPPSITTMLPTSSSTTPFNTSTTSVKCLHHQDQAQASEPHHSDSPLLKHNSTLEVPQSSKSRQNPILHLTTSTSFLFLNQETEASTLLPGFQTKLLVLDHLELNGYFFCVGPLFGYW